MGTSNSEPATATDISSNRKAVNPPRGRVTARALTEAGIRSIKAGQSRSDGALPVGSGRLIMRCTKRRGRLRRTWWFRVRKASQSTELLLGEHPTVSLVEARSHADRLIELVRGGADIRNVIMDRPMPSTTPAPPMVDPGASLRALLRSYVETLRRDGKASAGDVQALFARHVLEPWPDLADAAAASIDSALIRDVLARLVHMGIRRQTNVLRSYLQAAFTHGAHADLDPRRPEHESGRFKLSGNPVTLIPRIDEFEGARDRVLTDDEFRQVWLGLDQLRPEVAMSFRCSILLGGQRFRQLLRATWGDYDAARRLLQIEDSKGKRRVPVPHRLPVSDRVAQIIECLRVLNGRGTYIFSATAGRSPVHAATLSIAFAGLRETVAVSGDGSAPSMQARDLRRSIETRLQSLGVSRDIRAQLLSHGRTSGVQQRHYEHHDFLAEKAASLALLESHLFGLFNSARGAERTKKTVFAPPTRQNSVAHSVARRPRKRNGLAPCES